jgi:putative CocE/NonD family hydrolase
VTALSGKARSLALCLLISLCTSGCQLFVSALVLPKEGIRPATNGVRIERDLAMTTSDGVKLVADVYHPQVDGRTPTILVRIPFSRGFKNDLAAEVIARFWATRGYTVVIQGTRGRYKSGGAYYPLVHERADGVETLAWLARQPWFDGRLGTWGGSAFGYTQWAIADRSHPGPTAMIIQIASTDFYEAFYPGGAFSLETALFWSVRSRGEKDADPSFADLERGFSGFPLIEADERAGGDIPFFDDWASHTVRDAYWKAIDGENRARTIQAPVLLMAGWYDPFLPTQLRDFEKVRHHAKAEVTRRSRLVIGPWTHADPVRFPDGSTAGDYRAASLAPSIPWFDHHLMGEPLARSLNAPVRLYVMGENVWRDEQEWPLSRAHPVAYYLTSDGPANALRGNGRLTPEPAAAQRHDEYLYDPRLPVPTRGGAMLGPRAGIALQADVEGRDDVLVYSTATLDSDIEVTGPLRAVLHVTTSAPHTDFTVKLVDVHADGRAYNISDGILRRAYAPGDVSEITVELWPTSMLFRKGHRIRIEVSSSNYPRYDRNPNTGRDIPTERTPVSAMQRVLHGGMYPSRIILPVVPR